MKILRPRRSSVAWLVCALLLIVLCAALLKRPGFVVWNAVRGPAAADSPSTNQTSEMRSQTLAQVENLLDGGASPAALDAHRSLVGVCLQDGSPEIRIRAIRIALRAGGDWLNQVVSLLDDGVPEVRRAAMLAVGPSTAAVDTDNLLRCLHDSDEIVRKLCAEALRSRGLQEEHLRLGKLMTDAEAGSRLKVFDILQDTPDLDTGVWLRRLSHDPAPAVRAAAVRAGAQQAKEAFSDRLVQMAQNDPSPTVRQIAQYYLSAPQSVDMSSFSR